ncbi:MAG TPA: RNA polymerase sigma factor [Caulobacteraceae bacterium]|nr:RNA polymerase sigma factor [Caulobacteraceae bacterium]
MGLIHTASRRERALWLSANVLPHEPVLRRWLLSRRLPGVDVDDVIQETYTRIIQAENLQAIRNPKAYFFQAAWSVLLNCVRREKVVALQALSDMEYLSLEADSPTPEQQVVDRDELRRLAEAIAALPPKVGEVFRLRRVHGLSQKQAAAFLDLAESTIEKHMHRSLLLLSKSFAHGGYPAADVSSSLDKDVSPVHGRSQRNRGR